MSGHKLSCYFEQLRYSAEVALQVTKRAFRTHQTQRFQKAVK